MINTTAFAGSPLPFRPNALRVSHSPRMDSQAPPESRVAPYYPLKGRFEAPYLLFQDVPQVPLMNKIGVIREPVPLNMALAAELLAEARAKYVEQTGHFAQLFAKDATDTSAQSVVDKYFPASRRYEMPMIEIENTEDEQKVQVTVGQGVPARVQDVNDEQAEIMAKVGAFWKKKGTDVEGVVRRNYGKEIRNIAPVVEIAPGGLQLSVSMQKITGQPRPGSFANRYMMAPRIRMKKPAGDWDWSAFVEVGCEEVQLDLLAAQALKVDGSA